MSLKVVLRSKALRPCTSRLATSIRFRVLEIVFPGPAISDRCENGGEAYTDCASDGFFSSLPHVLHGGTDDLDFADFR
jgi:hypothetical protein